MNSPAERITEYLSLGGLFNPEMMNHNAVSALLIDCRAELSRLSALVAWQDIETAPRGVLIDIWIEEVDGDGRRWPEVKLTKDRLPRVLYYACEDEEDDWREFIPDENGQYITHWRFPPIPPVSQLNDTTNADK